MLFAGWFGPRGLASIVLGLIVIGEAPSLGGRDEIFLLVASTVFLSVLLHGVTAAPLSTVYVRRVEAMFPEAPEKKGAAEPLLPTGLTPSNEPEKAGEVSRDIHTEERQEGKTSGASLGEESGADQETRL